MASQHEEVGPPQGLSLSDWVGVAIVCGIFVLLVDQGVTFLIWCGHQAVAWMNAPFFPPQ